MPNPNEVSHGDILFQIGEMKGQLTTLITVVGQKREDLNGAFIRLGALEKSAVERPHLATVETRLNILERNVSQWVGFAVACSFVLPIAVSALKPHLSIGGPAQSSPQQIKP